MSKNDLINEYISRKGLIKSRLSDFRRLPEKEQFYEFVFCMLTPQSNAKKCWEAVEQLKKIPNLSQKKVSEVLASRTRFHNNKSRYVSEAQSVWPIVSAMLSNTNRKELRDQIASKVKGYGLKESSHFLRNIGKSDNQIAILDRHILKNLLAIGVIEEKDTNLKGRDHYHELESKFLKFSSEIGIPIDELDLLFWSRETGEVFK